MISEQQIRDMEPGRELDELVAEKVMGFKVYEDFPETAIYTGHTPTSFRVFRPSVLIASAWEVVEKMRLNHWYFMLSSENDGWEASFYWDAHRPSEDVLSESPAEAISKCALIAILRGGETK